MPRSYPRRILCDCFDCRGLTEEASDARPGQKAASWDNILIHIQLSHSDDVLQSFDGQLTCIVRMAAWKAAALQEPPPKCLMILIDLPEGDRGSNVQRIQYPNIDAVARDGRAGHLALRAVSGSHTTKDLSVFAQLLGISKVRIQGCRHFNLFLHRWYVPLQQIFFVTPAGMYQRIHWWSAGNRGISFDV